MCQHCQLNYYGNSGLCVSIANVNSHNNSGPCVNIVNSIIMETLALCQNCQLNHHDNSGPCASIVNSIIMATLALVSALSTQSSWHLWPFCQHCQCQQSWQLWPMHQHCQLNHHGNSGLVSALSTQSSWELWSMCQHFQLKFHGIFGQCVNIVNLNSQEHWNSGRCVSTWKTATKGMITICIYVFSQFLDSFNTKICTIILLSVKIF